MNPPDAAERELIGIVEPNLDEIGRRVDEMLVLFFKLRGAGIQERAEERQDGVVDDNVLFRILFERVKNKYFTERALKVNAYQGVAKQVDHFNFSQLETGLQKVFGSTFQAGVSPKGQRARLRKEFVTRTGSLTGDIETDLFSNIQHGLSKGLHEKRGINHILKTTLAEVAKSKLRLRLVARKEVAVLNFGLNKHLQKFLGFKKYRWKTAEDEKVRPRHILRHDKIYRWTFEHSDGHPGQPHNCFPAKSQVKVLGRTQVLMRHRYTGELTEIVTDTGETLRGTPNHPVLTRRGFVPLKLVDVGEDVFKASEQALNGDERDQGQRPAGFGECFNTLAAVFGVETRGGSKLQFHGDGSNDEVEVVLLESDLPAEWDVMACQYLCDLVLSRTHTALVPLEFECFRSLTQVFEALGFPTNRNMGFLCQTLALFWGQASHSDSIGFRGISRFYSSLKQASRDGSSLAAELLGQGQNANFVFDVTANQAFCRQLLTIVCRAAGTEIGGNAPSAKVLAEIVGMDAETKRGALERQAGIQKLGRVVEKRVSEFAAGHVYNLQSSCSWYVADSYLVHNCRCQAVPVIDAEIRATYSVTEGRVKVQVREPIRPPWLGRRRRLHTIADVDMGEKLPDIGELANPVMIFKKGEEVYESSREAFVEGIPSAPGKIADYYGEEIRRIRAKRKRARVREKARAAHKRKRKKSP